MAKSWRLISYDIREPKRLRKVAKILEGYGRRLQYSLFCCFLSDREAERLRFETRRVMEDEDDFLIVSLCASCITRLRSTEQSKAWPDEPKGFELILSTKDADQGSGVSSK